jgi:hypothetical protein
MEDLVDCKETKKFQAGNRNSALYFPYNNHVFVKE